jgi:hypothetical protein
MPFAQPKRNPQRSSRGGSALTLVGTWGNYASERFAGQGPDTNPLSQQLRTENQSEGD